VTQRKSSRVAIINEAEAKRDLFASIGDPDQCFSSASNGGFTNA
jgi:hypothetical protein